MGWVSASHEIATKTAQIAPITATRTRPCLRSRTIVPNVRVRLTGITSSRKISTRLESALGFSKGCAELALKMPPPFVPSSLIASWDPAGARGIVCAVPSTPRTSIPERSVITTPVATSTSAATNASGSRILTTPRVRSTQKLPIRSVFDPTNPLMSATATARPTAADRKFWTVSPTIWTVFPTTCSGT